MLDSIPVRNFVEGSSEVCNQYVRCMSFRSDREWGDEPFATSRIPRISLQATHFRLATNKSEKVVDLASREARYRYISLVEQKSLAYVKRYGHLKKAIPTLKSRTEDISCSTKPIGVKESEAA
jgi:hypothetical protein